MRVDPVRVRLEIPEREAAAVVAGQTVRVELGNPANPREGKVVRLSPAFDPENRTLTVEAELPNQDGSLRPGSFVEAHIVVDPAALALTIPAEAIVSFAGIDRVFVVRDGSAEERRVTLGRREVGRAEVLDGIEQGDAVILSPGKLASGTPVRVEN